MWSPGCLKTHTQWGWPGCGVLVGLSGRDRWRWGRLRAGGGGNGAYMWVKSGSGFKAARTGKNEHLVSTRCVPVTSICCLILPARHALGLPHPHFAENEPGASTEHLI